MNSNKYNNKKGFTLAEVLVTLAIIGVVASLTIPTLMNNMQNAELAAASKKGVSLVSQVSKMYKAENNGASIGACFSGNLMDEQAFNCFKDKLSIAKTGGIVSECFPIAVTYLNGDNFPISFTSLVDNGVFAKLNNGMSIAVEDYAGDCSTSKGTGVAQYACGHITLDVNGKKGPNVIGKDIHFLTVVRSGEIIPSGSYLLADEVAGSDFSKSCNPNTASGFGCLSRILKEGKINY